MDWQNTYNDSQLIQWDFSSPPVPELVGPLSNTTTTVPAQQGLTSIDWGNTQFTPPPTGHADLPLKPQQNPLIQLQNDPHVTQEVRINATTEEPEEIVAVSSTFFPGWHMSKTDLIFSSSDSVLFYVHSRIICRASGNAFRAYRPQITKGSAPGSPVITIPESSQVLNVVLHVLYGLSPAKYSPSFEVLQDAVNCMPKYDIVPKVHIVPGSPVYDLLLATAPLTTIRLYALAAHHDLYELAVRASTHLLSFDLSRIKADIAEFMGPRYLLRLMHLHLNRVNALKGMLLQAPYPHPPTPECGFEEQTSLSRAWALVSSYLVWDARPDLSVYRLQSQFGSLTAHMTCQTCARALHRRLKEVITKWASVRVKCNKFRKNHQI